MTSLYNVLDTYSTTSYIMAEPPAFLRELQHDFTQATMRITTATTIAKPIDIPTDINTHLNQCQNLAFVSSPVEDDECSSLVAFVWEMSATEEVFSGVARDSLVDTAVL